MSNSDNTSNKPEECNHEWVVKKCSSERYFEKNDLGQSVMVTPVSKVCPKCTATCNDVERLIAGQG